MGVQVFGPTHTPNAKQTIPGRALLYRASAFALRPNVVSVTSFAHLALCVILKMSQMDQYKTGKSAIGLFPRRTTADGDKSQA